MRIENLARTVNESCALALQAISGVAEGNAPTISREPNETLSGQVLSLGNSDYKYLVGRVISVDKLGSPEHDSDNDTDDYYVDFSGANYSKKRVAEIEDYFTELYDDGEKKTLDDIALDDVIMSSDMLASIANISAADLSAILDSEEGAVEYCRRNNFEKIG